MGTLENGLAAALLLGALGLPACSSYEPLPANDESATASQALNPAWTPNDLEPMAWYKATAGVVPGELGIAEWQDQSGNGRHIGHTIIWNRPQFSATGWNGTQPTVIFDGNDLLRLDTWSGSPAGANSGFTVLAVMRSAEARNAGVAAWWDPNGGSAAWTELATENGLTYLNLTRIDGFFDKQIYTRVQDIGTNRHVVAWRYSPDPPTMMLTLDGSTTSSDSFPPLTGIASGVFILGAMTVLPTGWFKGDISELVVVDGSISEEDVGLFTQYARTVWSGLPSEGGFDPCLDAGGQPTPDTTRCDDGYASTVADHCASGTCVGSVPGTGNPGDLSPLAWYHAGAAEVALSSGVVTTWFDRSPYHRHLVQAYSSVRPAFNATGWNGNKPTLTFDDDFLRRRAWTDAPAGTGSAFTVLAVLKPASAQNSGVASWFSPISYGKVACRLKNTTGTFLELFRGTDANLSQSFSAGADLGGGRHVVAWRYTPDVLKLTLDGTTVTSASLAPVGSIDIDTIFVGTLSDQPNGGRFAGDISELAIIPFSISDRAVAEFNTYAQNEWGGLTLCSPDCAGKACGAANGCGGECSCEPKVECDSNSDCPAGLICWLDSGRHFGKRADTGICAPSSCVPDPQPDCGSFDHPCGLCSAPPTPCSNDTDCSYGEVCGEDNGPFFDLPEGLDVCWPPICPGTAPGQHCGSPEAACGYCDCSAICETKTCGDDPSNGCGGNCEAFCADGEGGCHSDSECQPGSVCAQAVGERFGFPAATNVCMPASCLAYDPELPNCGVTDPACGECLPPLTSTHCGDAIRDPVTEECDDGPGSQTDACAADCRITDLPVAPLERIEGERRTRTLGFGRHPLASGPRGTLVTYTELDDSASQLRAALFQRRGRPMTTFELGAGADPSQYADASVAAAGNDYFAVAWNELGHGSLDIALRLVPATGSPALEAVILANSETTGAQQDPDLVWTGNELVAAWSSEFIVHTRRFDADLTPIGVEQPLSAPDELSGNVSLANFADSWAAAWRALDDDGGEVIRVHSTAADWSMGPFLPGAADERPALVELDATHLLVVYSEGTDPLETGTPTVTRLRAAVLNTGVPGVTGAFSPETFVAPYATDATVAQAYPTLARVGTKLFLGWETENVIGSALSAEVWVQELSWSTASGLVESLEHPVPLTAGREDAQFAVAFAASPLFPEGALSVAWEQHADAWPYGARPDIVFSLRPVPFVTLP